MPGDSDLTAQGDKDLPARCGDAPEAWPSHSPTGAQVRKRLSLAGPRPPQVTRIGEHPPRPGVRRKGGNCKGRAGLEQGCGRTAAGSRRRAGVTALGRKCPRRVHGLFAHGAQGRASTCVASKSDERRRSMWFPSTRPSSLRNGREVRRRLHRQTAKWCIYKRRK